VEKVHIFNDRKLEDELSDTEENRVLELSTHDLRDFFTNV